jgi:hypothetical protein
MSGNQNQLQKDASSQSIMYLTSAYKNSPFGASKASLGNTAIRKPDGSKLSLAGANTLEGMTLQEYRDRKRIEQEVFNATQVDSVRLPELDLVKTHTSTFISRNPNRSVKAYDFQGYTTRKSITDGFPEPVESQFIA